MSQWPLTLKHHTRGLFYFQVPENLSNRNAPKRYYLHKHHKYLLVFLIEQQVMSFLYTFCYKVNCKHMDIFNGILGLRLITRLCLEWCWQVPIRYKEVRYKVKNVKANLIAFTFQIVDKRHRELVSRCLLSFLLSNKVPKFCEMSPLRGNMSSIKLLAKFMWQVSSNSWQQK